MILILIFVLYDKKVEHYYDIIPYKYRWNIGKCWDNMCLTDKYNACTKWCDYLHDLNRHVCKYRCGRYAANQVIYNRWGYRNWMKNMKDFDGSNMINRPMKYFN